MRAFAEARAGLPEPVEPVQARAELQEQDARVQVELPAQAAPVPVQVALQELDAPGLELAGLLPAQDALPVPRGPVQPSEQPAAAMECVPASEPRAALPDDSGAHHERPQQERALRV